MNKSFSIVLVLLLISACCMAQQLPEPRPRARSYGIPLGILPTGELNAITDVPGVLVGHCTLYEGETLRTGITAVLPHGGNLFLSKVPAAIEVGNGFGKLMGSTQVNELGELETPILLTGTLNVPRVADGLISYMLALPGMENVMSINPVVGETNDGFLSDIRLRPLGEKEVREAIESASGGPVPMGVVGAGTGTRCFGYKGGIGSSSRKLPESLGGWTVGVIVQTNFGGVLTHAGINLAEELDNYPFRQQLKEQTPEGSIMIVVATDAPLDHRNLKRLAKRAFLGMARTGGYASNGSGDYAIAFSTHQGRRINRGDDPVLQDRPVLDNEAMSPLFLAAVEATQESILDSLFCARTVKGHMGTAEELPVDRVIELLKRK